MPVVLVDTQGAQLEADVHLPKSGPNEAHPQFSDTGVLLVHPFSKLGGSMHDYVIEELWRQLCLLGQFGVVIRYNQRGVGTSTSRQFQLFNNIRGQQDATDVLDMVVFTTDQITGHTNKRIIIIGYSFGACLAAQALVHPSIVAYIGISFPLGGLSFLLRSKDAFNKVWSASHVPRLLVLGSDDQYTKQKAMQNAMAAGGGVLLDNINTNSGQIIPPSKTSGKSGSLLLKMFEGNSHFWENDCSLMVEFVLRYCEQVLQMQEPE